MKTFEFHVLKDGERLSQLYLELVDAYKKKFSRRNKVLSNREENEKKF